MPDLPGLQLDFDKISVGRSVARRGREVPTPTQSRSSDWPETRASILRYRITNFSHIQSSRKEYLFLIFNLLQVVSELFPVLPNNQSNYSENYGELCSCIGKLSIS